MTKRFSPVRFCVTVIGSDRPGIIAKVTGVFSQFGGNLEDASMTILNGEFAMIFIVTLISDKKLGVLSKSLAAVERSLKLNIEIRKIPELKPSDSHKTKTPYLITVFGPDRVGIVHRISSVLSKLGINITDLQSKQIKSGKNMIYGLLLEVDLPRKIKLEQMRSHLTKIARSLKVDLSVKPIESVTF